MGGGSARGESDEPRRLADRGRAAILLPLVIGLVYLGGWWLFGLALVGGLFALHELYVMARVLRPLVLGGLPRLRR